MTCTLSSQFPQCSVDVGESQSTVQEVQLKIKMIKNLKHPTGCFPVMNLSDGVETYSNR